MPLCPTRSDGSDPSGRLCRKRYRLCCAAGCAGPILDRVIGGAFGVTLANARTGDEAAFACIFRDVQPALLRYLRVITAEPEDVAGETWIQVVTGLRRFRGGEQDFRAWLFTIARNRAADAGRSRHRRPSVPLDMTEAAQQLTTPDAADQALEAVSTQAAMDLIKSLPREQAEIIMLRVVVGLDAGDVAKVVGKTPGAVRVAAHRGLRRLAGQVAQAGVTL
jgi:RNA polymerase sigma-70 factor (ECF subfamily)